VALSFHGVGVENVIDLLLAKSPLSFKILSKTIGNYLLLTEQDRLTNKMNENLATYLFLHIVKRWENALLTLKTLKTASKLTFKRRRYLVESFAVGII